MCRDSQRPSGRPYGGFAGRHDAISRMRYFRREFVSLMVGVSAMRHAGRISHHDARRQISRDDAAI